LQAGLVTGLKSKAEVEQRLAGMVGEDHTNASFMQVSNLDYVRIVHAQNGLGVATRPASA